MTELEQKAEEYAVNSCGSSPLQEDLRECAKYSFKDGYEQGQLSSNSLQLQKENEELKKATVEKNSEVEELKAQIEKLKGFEEIQKKIWKMFGSYAELKQLYESIKNENKN